MREHRLECLRCGKSMEEGYLLEKGHYNAVTVTTWVEGAPERSRWTGLKVKGRRVMPVRTFRCTGCGSLASFAPDGGM